MATSGTIATTRINVAQFIEKAIRRCGLSPTSITPETVQTAKESLYMLILSQANRGLNLWCIDSQLIDIVANQATYVLPDGTVDVLNVNLCTFAEDGTRRDLPITPLNRDDYAAIPVKLQKSAVPVNYFFERLRAPQITLWPVPNDATKKIQVFRTRDVEDIGALQNEIDVPNRWLESLCWQLALRLAFELPDVKAERVALVKQMADSMTIEVEGGETDGSPTYFAPAIGVYTR